jgi:flagellar biosynthesis protein
MNDTPSSFDFTEQVRPPDAPRAGPQKAVAIHYERGEEPAPTVVASGKGAIAEQILQLAFANGIKVREDAELVEILSLVDVDSPIPLEAFTAVAEILAYVYQANAGFKQRAQAALYKDNPHE